VIDESVDFFVRENTLMTVAPEAAQRDSQPPAD
jgi:hypothetical protein